MELDNDSEVTVVAESNTLLETVGYIDLPNDLAQQAAIVGYIGLPQALIQQANMNYPTKRIVVPSNQVCGVCNFGPCCEHLITRLTLKGNYAMFHNQLGLTNLDLEFPEDWVNTITAMQPNVPQPATLTIDTEPAVNIISEPAASAMETQGVPWMPVTEASYPETGTFRNDVGNEPEQGLWTSGNLFQRHRQSDKGFFVGGRRVPGCAYCYSNKEIPSVYLSHVVRSGGITTCPVLRAYRCRKCNATGDQGHTAKYCPTNQEEEGNRYRQRTLINSCGMKPYYRRF